MNKRKLSGLILLSFGIFMLLAFAFLGSNVFLVSLIYLLPIVIIGIIIFFNDGEDKIEQINYSKVRKEDKK